MTYSEAVKQITKKFGLDVAKEYTEVNKLLSKPVQTFSLIELKIKLKLINNEKEILFLFTKFLYNTIADSFISSEKYLFDTINEILNDDELLEESKINGFLRSIIKLKTHKEVAEIVYKTLEYKLDEHVYAHSYSESLPGTSAVKIMYRNKSIKETGNRLEKVSLCRKYIKFKYIDSTDSTVT